MFDTIPGRHPRLVAWAIGFRKAGYPAKTVADWFGIELSLLVEAGMKP